jgi:hypothetical protein
MLGSHVYNNLNLFLFFTIVLFFIFSVLSVFLSKSCFHFSLHSGFETDFLSCIFFRLLHIFYLFPFFLILSLRVSDLFYFFYHSTRFFHFFCLIVFFLSCSCFHFLSYFCVFIFCFTRFLELIFCPFLHF